MADATGASGNLKEEIRARHLVGAFVRTTEPAG